VCARSSCSPSRARPRAEELGSDTRQVEVGDIPGDPVEGRLEEERLECSGAHEDDGGRQGHEYGVLLVAREEPADHRLELRPRELWGIDRRKRRMGSTLRPPRNSRRSAPRTSPQASTSREEWVPRRFTACWPSRSRAREASRRGPAPGPTSHNAPLIRNTVPSRRRGGASSRATMKPDGGHSLVGRFA
jgi:hypothetical protein